MSFFQMAPIFILFVFFSIIFYAALRSAGKESNKRIKKFLEGEDVSSNIRRKPIDTELFFVPDLDGLPIKEYTAEEAEKFPVLIARQERVIAISKNKMIRFKEPKSNLEVKMQFGTISVEEVANYEESYSQYIYALVNWAESLMEAGNFDDAEKVLSVSIEQGSEISKSFTLLADIYFRNNDKPKMEDLYETVSTINIPAQKKAWEHINNYLLKM